MKIKHLIILGLCSSVFGLSGCVGAGVGAGATVGVASAQEGGIPAAITDFKIQTQINSLWFQHDVDVFRKLDLTVNQGRVLITGVVQNPQHRVDAVRLAWQVSGVEQVINEIRVADSQGVAGFAKDTWITTQLRSKMVFEKKIQSINYSIDTVQGVVYLMGVAKNQEELNRAIDIARMVSGVKQVVSYVKFSGQPLTEEELDARRDFQGSVTDTTTYQTEYQSIPPSSEGSLPPSGYFSENGGGRAPVQSYQLDE